MLVRDRMTADPITIIPETSYEDALRLMRTRRVRRFPVVNPQRRVVGIVSEKDLLNAGPSPATTLDRYEIATLLAKLKVRDVMTRGVITATPELPLEEAARIMADNKIGGLPVVDDQHQLAGIITETDIFRTMVEMLGARRRGLRLTFRVEDQRGALAQLAGEITRQGGNIITIGVFQGDDQMHPVITTKVEFVDEERLVATLRSKGAEMLDVRRV
jgi:acetoin utilization protein AcuB